MSAKRVEELNRIIHDVTAPASEVIDACGELIELALPQDDPGEPTIREQIAELQVRFAEMAAARGRPAN